MKIITNATSAANRIAEYLRKMDGAVYAGLKKIAAAAERAQLKNLKGHHSAEPGSYPVPNRTGHLFREAFFEMTGATTAVVGNKASYALAVHDAEGGSSSATYGPRPFVTDAVDAVDAGEIMATELRKVWNT